MPGPALYPTSPPSLTTTCQVNGFLIAPRERRKLRLRGETMQPVSAEPGVQSQVLHPPESKTQQAWRHTGCPEGPHTTASSRACAPLKQALSGNSVSSPVKWGPEDPSPGSRHQGKLAGWRRHPEGSYSRGGWRRQRGEGGRGSRAERGRQAPAQAQGPVSWVVFLDGLLSVPSPCLRRRKNPELAGCACLSGYI